MQLYFIRHGQSFNNAHWGKPDFKESPDPIHTETGIQQAKILADYLEVNQQITGHNGWDVQNYHGYGFTHIYASLMERAVHTVSYTAGNLGVPFKAWDIHESGGIFGREGAERLAGLPGKSRSFFENNFPGFELPNTLDESGWWNKPFETEDECQQHADHIWSELLIRHGDKPR